MRPSSHFAAALMLGLTCRTLVHAEALAENIQDVFAIDFPGCTPAAITQTEDKVDVAFQVKAHTLTATYNPQGRLLALTLKGGPAPAGKLSPEDAKEEDPLLLLMNTMDVHHKALKPLRRDTWTQDSPLVTAATFALFAELAARGHTLRPRSLRGEKAQAWHDYCDQLSLAATQGTLAALQNNLKAATQAYLILRITKSDSHDTFE